MNEKNFEVALYEGDIVGASHVGTDWMVYRLPYALLKSNRGKIKSIIDNKFIVYVLIGINLKGKDYVYTGKSINGVNDRPTSHDDKYNNWTDCFILTEKPRNNELNGGMISCIEDGINRLVEKLSDRFENTTKTTSSTAQKNDRRVADDYIETIVPMLYCLGLDLSLRTDNYRGNCNAKKAVNSVGIEDGVYYLKKSRKGIEVRGELLVRGDSYTLKKGSGVYPIEEHLGMAKNVSKAREDADAYIVNDKLIRDYVNYDLLGTLSACAEFITGTSENGWTAWQTKDGISLKDKFRP